MTQSLQPRPGTTILIGIAMDPKPGWHGYWSNPGDSGIAPSVQWNAPEGVTLGALHHPAPSLMRVGEDVSFVHEGEHILLVPMTVSGKVRAGTALPVTAHLTWGSCTDKACVPERATLSLELLAGNGKAGPHVRALAAARAKLPKPARPSRYALGKATIALTVPKSLGLVPSRVRFFPEGGDYFDAGSATVGSVGRFVTIKATRRSAPPRTITGVVSDGRKAYRIRFRRT